MTSKRTEIKEIQQRAKELRELLAEFGARLSGFDPGVSAYLVGQPVQVIGDGSGCFGEHLSFNAIQWRWLKPLLDELREYRRRNGRLRVPNMAVFRRQLREAAKKVRDERRAMERAWKIAWAWKQFRPARTK